VAEPRYLSACTRATTVFAILTVFFAVKPGLAFSVLAAENRPISARVATLMRPSLRVPS
jgi:hypothetical protein